MAKGTLYVLPVKSILVCGISAGDGAAFFDEAPEAVELAELVCAFAGIAPSVNMSPGILSNMSVFFSVVGLVFIIIIPYQ